jgi:hypothetical protein
MDPFRRFIHFETTPDGGGGESGGGEPPAPEPPDSGGEAAASASLDPAVIESLSGLAQHAPALSALAEQFQTFQENPDEYGQQAQQVQYDPYTGQPLQQQPPEIPDPSLDPAGFQNWIGQRDQALLEQMQERLSPLVGFYADQQAQQQITEGFGALPEDARIESMVPEASAEQAREALQAVAVAFVDPQNPDVRGALSEGAGMLRGLLQSAGEKAVADYKASLSNGGNQVREPGITGAGIEAVDTGLSYDEIIERASTGAL